MNWPSPVARWLVGEWYGLTCVSFSNDSGKAIYLGLFGPGASETNTTSNSAGVFSLVFVILGWLDDF